MKKTLLNKTIDLVNQSDKNPSELAKETGLGERWLYNFANGVYSDPGVNKVERLYNHLLEAAKAEARA